MNGRGFRLLVWGCESTLTSLCLRRLLAEKCQVAALLVPGSALVKPEQGWRFWQPLKRQLSMLQTDGATSVRQLAHEAGIPVIEVFSLRNPALIPLLQSYRADIACVACFPRLLPASVRDVVHVASINVHPSLLPRYRGPDPIFWILQDRLTESGVTVHDLSDQFDSGPILAQRRFPLPESLTYEQLEIIASEQGADLLLTVLTQFEQGSVTPLIQNEEQASYQGYPEGEKHGMLETEQ